MGGSSSPVVRLQPREFSLPLARFEGETHVRDGSPTRGLGSQKRANIHLLKFQQALPLFGEHV